MSDLGFERLIALVALGGTYLGLALGRLPFLRVDRTGVAIIGGALVVVSGLLPWDRAVAAVDAHTLVLLFGMMIVAAYLRLSGFFRLVTYAAVRRARTPVGLLGLIIVAAGVLSALFVNDVVCLVMAPIVVDLVRQFRLPPVPYLIALATAVMSFPLLVRSARKSGPSWPARSSRARPSVITSSTAWSRAAGAAPCASP